MNENVQEIETQPDGDGVGLQTNNPAWLEHLKKSGMAPAEIAAIAAKAGYKTLSAEEVEAALERQEQEGQPDKDGEVIEEPASFEPEPYALKLTDVPAETLKDEYVALAADFSRVAPQAGLSREMSQAMLDTVIEGEATLPFLLKEDDGPEEAYGQLQAVFGQEQAQVLVGKAYGYARTRPKLSAWLDESGMGNSPSVLVALALAAEGTYSLSKPAALKQLQAIYDDRESGYYSTDARVRRLALAKVSALSRIAYADEDEVKHANAAFAAAVKKPDAISAKPAPDKVAQARKAAAEMLNNRESDLNRYQPGNPKRAAAVAEFQRLLAIVSG